MTVNAGGGPDGGAVGEDGGDEGNGWSSAHGGLPEATAKVAAAAVTDLTALTGVLTRPNVEQVARPGTTG